MKKKKSALPVTAGLIVVLCLAAVFFTGQRRKVAEQKSGGDTEISSGEEEVKETTVIGEGESLVIPVSEITSEAVFLPVEVDGTEMEIIAVRGSDGSIRTAFNTCQVCYDSGRGYYVQQDALFICQNCGNRFTADEIETESGGCNPWPIFEKDKTVTEESVEITYEFLAESKDIFANWKRSYE